jgi:hypothetical protein
VGYTAEYLIADVKRLANIPNSQPNWDDSAILDFLTEELQGVVAPMVIASREDYFTQSADYAIPSTSSDYILVPSRAAGGVIREIQIVDSSGNTVENLTRLMPESFASRKWWNQINTTDSRQGSFWVLGNKIYMSTSNASGNLCRIYYYTRPSKLVLSTAAGQISAISGNDVTVTSMPADLASLTALDCVQGVPQFEVLATSSACSIVSNVATFTAAPSGLAVGDFICAPYESPVINLPLELHKLVVQGAVVKILEAMRDASGVQVALGRYKQLLDTAKNLIQPRVPGEPKIIDTSRGLL